MTAIIIRPEAAGDEAAIHMLTEAAFRDKEFSNGSEPDLVDMLRRDGDLALSLVAHDADRIVGHIAFSPIVISDGSRHWYGLGPVSVWPEMQGQGTGFRLVQRGIADIREAGAQGVVVLGDPDFYGRFGFEHDPELTYPGSPPGKFQRLSFNGTEPRGSVTYSKAFA